MQSYKDLIVWQKGIELTALIYKLTDRFSKSEQFGLTSQMRRASVSIPSNLAECYARKHRAEFLQFVRIAYGSGAEIETQLILVKRLGFSKDKDLLIVVSLLDEIMRMLNRLSSSLVAKP